MPVAKDSGLAHAWAMSDLSELIASQSGVVARFQLIEHGVAPTVIRRQLRRRDLVMVVPGVYVDHTGELTWVQAAWVRVLALWPAALTHHSAIRADDGPGRRDPDRLIHVAVDRTRSPDTPPGVRLHQLAQLDVKVQWNLCPPRVRIEEALLDVAAEAGNDLEAITVLADAVQARRTTAARLIEALAQRTRIARRVVLEAVLRDIDDGTCSALEHGYLALVERPHGLPSAHRQVRGSNRGPIFRDVEYSREAVFVELDGRLFHDNARSRDRDLDRDLEAALDNRVTLRIGWGQVYGRGCDTARRVGLVLQRRGWAGGPVPCPRCAATSVQYFGVTG